MRAAYHRAAGPDNGYSPGVESQRRRPPAEQPAQSADALTLEQVEAVLRRAVQLEQRKHVPDAAGLSREELTRIALEAGLSPEAVEEA
ncbi:MAG: hypothetical protein ACJ78X_10020, partial [Myxococcales bacterium]